jgi:hypothetical protein
MLIEAIQYFTFNPKEICFSGCTDSHFLGAIVHIDEDLGGSLL